MGRVDFIVAEDGVELDRLRMVCAIAEQYCLSRRPLAVHTATAEQRATLDMLLWTYSDTSFLAHGGLPAEAEPTVPILLLDKVAEPAVPAAYASMINLTERVPPNRDKQAHVIEVVSHDVDVKQAARERYRVYKAAGSELRTQRIRSYSEITV